jgi:hypothetical protein
MVHTNAYPNAGYTTAKPWSDGISEVVLLTLEAMLTIKLLLIV